MYIKVEIDDKNKRYIKLGNTRNKGVVFVQ